MGVKVAKLWRMHMFALAVCLLMPPIWRRFVNTYLMHPVLSEEPEQSVDVSTPADVSSYMQVGIQVNSGTPTFNSRIVAAAAAVSQQKGWHANVPATDAAVTHQREEHKCQPVKQALRPELSSESWWQPRCC